MDDLTPTLVDVPELPAPLPVERTPSLVRSSLVRAAASPSAVAVTAVGAGIGVLDQSVVLAVVLGACGWTARMLVAMVAFRRRRRPGRATLPHLDPWSLPEPWRELLQRAEAVRIRFDQALASWPPGPTRDRLAGMQPQVHEEISRLGLSARQGATAGGWTGPQPLAGRPSTESLTTEIQRIQAERARLGDGAPARREDIARREEALAADLRARHRASRAETELHDRLSLAVGRLDETVTQVLAAGIRPFSDEGEPALEELSTGIASLQAAIDETAGAPPDSATP